MSKTSLQISKSRLIDSFLYNLLGILLIIATIFWQSISLQLRVLIILGVFLIITSVIYFSRRKSNIKVVYQFVDRPFPLAVDLLKGLLKNTLLVIFLYLVSTPLLWYGMLLGIVTPITWLYGAIAFGVWSYIIDLIGFLSTRYYFLDDGIRIINGPREVFILYSELSTSDIALIPKIPFITKLRTRSPFILGVRDYNLVAIKQNIKDYLTVFTPQIYLTPKNPFNFYNLLRNYIIEVEEKNQQVPWN